MKHRAAPRAATRARRAGLARWSPGLLCFGLGLGHAPLQCASDPEGPTRRQESPAEALYGLARQFDARGERDAWRSTLEYLIARYPNSRFATMARADLDAGGGPSTAP